MELNRTDFLIPTLLPDLTSSDVSIDYGSDVKGRAELPEGFKIANLVVRLLFGVLALIGNTLTIAAIAKYQFLRNNPNYLIGALASADLLGGILPILILVHYVLELDFEKWVMVCILEQFISNLSSGLNVITTMWISFDRFLYITFPLRYNSMLKSWQVFCIIAFSWIFICMQLIIFSSLGHGLSPGVACRSVTVWPHQVRFVIANGQFVIYSAITFIVYAWIGVTALKQKRAINQQVAPEMQARSKRENKITKMMVTVLGVYFACYLPQVVVLALFGTLVNPPIWSIILERTTTWIWWVNAFVNPAIYAWKSKDFAKAFQNIIGWKKAEVEPATASITGTA